MKTSLFLNRFFCLAMLFLSLGSYAQISTVNTYKNLITVKESRGDLVGSPYLFPQWEVAELKFPNGIKPITETINYDLLDDILVAKGENDQEFSFKDLPSEFIVSNNKEIFRSGFAAVDGLKPTTFYNVLYDGKLKLLKKIHKTIIESKGYNSATVTKKVDETVNYYLVVSDNKPQKVKLNEKSFIEVLGKPAELSKYVKENKIDLKSNSGAAKLLAFYEGL